MNVHSILAVKGAEVATVSPRASLADATAQLRDRKIGALVVSDDGVSILGILSERDIVRALANHGASALGQTVASAMTVDVVTCVANDSVEFLMISMTERRLRHLPVVDGEGKLSGVVSIGDVVKGRLTEVQTDNDALIEYLHQGR